MRPWLTTRVGIPAHGRAGAATRAARTPRLSTTSGTHSPNHARVAESAARAADRFLTLRPLHPNPRSLPMFGLRFLLVTLLIVATPSTSHQHNTHSNVATPQGATQTTDPLCMWPLAAACHCTEELRGLSAFALVSWPGVLDPTPDCGRSFATVLALTQAAALRTFPVAEAICLALHLSQDPALVHGVPLPVGLCSNLVRTLSEYSSSGWSIACVGFCDVAPPALPTTTLASRTDHDALALHWTNTEARAL